MSMGGRPGTAEIIVAWWESVRPDPVNNERGDRALVARLKRYGSVTEALMEPSVLLLARHCGVRGEDDFLLRIALAAMVLAYVRQDGRERVARQIGPRDISALSPAADTALYKPVRFRRLLNARSPDECLRAFRRLIRMIEGPVVNVRDMAETLLAWPGEDERAERIRRRWAYDYWTAGDAPATASTISDMETVS